MVWTIEYDTRALKDLKALDGDAQRRILNFFDDKVALADDPRYFAKPLRGNLRKLWRFRIGDYRAVCDIQERCVLVHVVRVGHRKDVYE